MTTSNLFDAKIDAHYSNRRDRGMSALDVVAWQIELELINTKKELVSSAQWLAAKMAALVDQLEQDPDRKVYGNGAVSSLHANVERLAAQAEGLQRALDAVRATAERDQPADAN